MPDYIGVVDLTVRLSSMNPLAHIGVQDANRRFEGALIQACRTLYDAESTSEESREGFRTKGIVPYGASDKYFHFERYEDVVLFARTLRSRLLAEKLPFKLCISKGDLTRGSLHEKLGALMATLPEGAKNLPSGADEIEKAFGTTSIEKINTLIDLYRADSASESSVALATAMEAFKGFGIWIDADIALPQVDDIFRNYFPTWGPNRRLVVSAFLDCTFARNDADVVTRLAPEASEASHAEAGTGKRGKGKGVEQAEPQIVKLASGVSAMIDDILELLRRSSKAGDDNSIYYVSLLTTIARSSNFAKLDHLGKQRPLKPGSAKILAAGWQFYPPIFHTLALDHGHRAMIKKIPGIELTLAALIDMVHAAKTLEPMSAAYPSPTVAERKDAAAALLKEACRKDSVFGVVVRHIEATFGEAMMRRIWAVPHDVLNDERKRAMLEVMTSK